MTIRLLFWFCVLYFIKIFVRCEEVDIHIPKNVLHDGDVYKFDHHPPFGHPAPHTTFAAKDIRDGLKSTSRNFTMRPNIPGKMTVWFRNETALLVLWKSPDPLGLFSHQKVSIYPPDAIDSVVYIKRRSDQDGYPDIPEQIAFKGLVPGRAYNITIETMFEDVMSHPTVASYRTVPSRPTNVSIDSVTAHSFVVRWEPPSGKGEFDSYEISLVSVKKQPPVVRSKEEPRHLEFKDQLEPGSTYQVTVKTRSGRVTSWPVSTEVTLYMAAQMP